MHSKILPSMSADKLKAKVMQETLNIFGAAGADISGGSATTVNSSSTHGKTHSTMTSKRDTSLTGCKIFMSAGAI